LLTRADLIQLIVGLKRKVDAPVAPKPKPEPEPKPLSHMQRALNDVRAGKAIDMNDLLRSIPKPKPPRKPSWER
jgi:hypothetical protein